MRFLLLLVLAAAGCANDSFDLDGGDLVPLGAAYVDHRKCHDCHDGEKGPMAGRAQAVAGTSYAANLTPDRDTGLGGWADIEIVRAMRFGFDNQNEPLCPPMPHFSDMDDLEARAIIAYLRSLPSVTRPDIPGSVCPPLKPPSPSFTRD
jgi:hypothetical protein